MTEKIFPAEADEARFWSLIESAWTALGDEPARLRHELLTGAPGTDPYAIDAWLDRFVEQLTALSADLSSAELTALDRVLERKLHDLDRADIHEVTDGSDDGFLYARGHIVALGRAYYDAVSADPQKAVVDADCEAMCYLFANLHQERFGSWPETGSGISRESGSNSSGWSS
ncbi:hypothetical protein ACWT_1542 [Actinoplanes sp. SE50]|uniref:DUF4240 domain-containing protein n=1 Tax=unclassified Actinoplanes TaxID=2626549 RepID=UPI00023EC752|nr:MULTISPECIES: DUF4240 domain-containing protein [unclassified Actinoplanes]AEV82561.1 hypothetical protein ACPL_1664 [Actinoplanes sp. SE50/110]ATO80957.1 hypothetical protein ACWT_1542 [Actinoplanes sp. SE50]SLL98364.1 hypothetical protein ACSP50_1590 [Actinoplanes sp. SE50/110]